MKSRRGAKRSAFSAVGRCVDRNDIIARLVDDVGRRHVADGHPHHRGCIRLSRMSEQRKTPIRPAMAKMGTAFSCGGTL
ncbi:MAG: hypothetical protein ABI877_07165, partial [Gemmatimonadaceae bacterium]